MEIIYKSKEYEAYKDRGEYVLLDKKKFNVHVYQDLDKLDDDLLAPFSSLYCESEEEIHAAILKYKQTKKY